MMKLSVQVITHDHKTNQLVTIELEGLDIFRRSGQAAILEPIRQALQEVAAEHVCGFCFQNAASNVEDPGSLNHPVVYQGYWCHAGCVEDHEIRKASAQELSSDVDGGIVVPPTTKES